MDRNELKRRLLAREPGKVSLGAPTTQELAPVGRYALVPTNPAVVKIAQALHWKPATAIERIKRALPAMFEQQIYLSVAGSFRIQPESLATLLSIYRGDRPLSTADLERRPLGENIVSNSFGDFADFFEGCMYLVKIFTKEYRATISMELAGLLVLAYGPDGAEKFIEMIDANIDECCEFFGMNARRSYSEKMRTCVFLFVTELLPELRRRGVPDMLDPSDLFTDEDLRGLFRERSHEGGYSDTEVQIRLDELLNGEHR